MGDVHLIRKGALNVLYSKSCRNCTAPSAVHASAALQTYFLSETLIVRPEMIVVKVCRVKIFDLGY